MRFMMLVIPGGYEEAPPGAMPEAERVSAMMAYNESLQKAGVLRALDGLHPPSMGARVSFSGGRARVEDGPFPEVKEVLGGYWIIDVASKQEAIEWASRAPMSDDERIEIRQVQEFEDFPPDVQAAAAGFVELQAAAQRSGGHPARVMHFEVNGRDGKRLQEFYTALFQWQVNADNPMQYGIVSAPSGGIGGGISGSGEPGVTFYVEVTSLTEALAKAERLGGRTVFPPHQVPNGPRIAHFADPEGNVIGLLEASPQPCEAG